MYIRSFVFLLLVLLCHSQKPTLSLSYSFPHNSSGIINPYYNTAFQLGTLSVNYSISATFTLPQIATSAYLTTLIGLLNGAAN